MVGAVMLLSRVAKKLSKGTGLCVSHLTYSHRRVAAAEDPSSWIVTQCVPMLDLLSR